MGLLGAQTRSIRHEALTRRGDWFEIEIKDPLHPGFTGAANGDIGMMRGGLNSDSNLPDHLTRQAPGLASKATPQDGGRDLVVRPARIVHRVVKGYRGGDEASSS